MMGKKKIIVYEKPTCSTCRAVLKELNGKEVEKINYYKTPFTSGGLKKLLKKMRMKPRDILRTKEEIYRKLELAKKDLSDDALIRLMIKNPDLIQRPIVVKGNKVVLARPVERVKEIL